MIKIQQSLVVAAWGFSLSKKYHMATIRAELTLMSYYEFLKSSTLPGWIHPSPPNKSDNNLVHVQLYVLRTYISIERASVARLVP